MRCDRRGRADNRKSVSSNAKRGTSPFLVANHSDLKSVTHLARASFGFHKINPCGSGIFLAAPQSGHLQECGRSRARSQAPPFLQKQRGGPEKVSKKFTFIFRVRTEIVQLTRKTMRRKHWSSAEFFRTDRAVRPETSV